MLTRRGVTAWRRALADLAPDPSTHPTPATPAGAAAAVPATIAAELVDALAAVALAGA